MTDESYHGAIAPTLMELVDRRLVETFGHGFIERRLAQHRESKERLAEEKESQ